MNGIEQLYNLLKETFLLLDFGDRQLFGRFDLTVSRFYALHHLAEEPGISLSQLSNRMFCDKSNITRLIKGLEADGYVVRRRHDRDGRVACLFLTDAGAALQVEVAAAHHAFNAVRLGRLDDRQYQFLEQNLVHLRERLHATLQAEIIAGR